MHVNDTLGLQIGKKIRAAEFEPGIPRKTPILFFSARRNDRIRQEMQVERAKTEATVDFLTGVANRKAFDEALTKLVGESNAASGDLCLLMIDIDHFKGFNDKYGHIVGDEVLKFVSKKIKQIVKGRDFLARYGGEEFALILPQTSLGGAKTVAENIRVFFAQARLKSTATSTKLGVITVSIGAAYYRSGEPLESFVNRFDKALYFAKNNGRNRVATETELELAIEN